MNLYELDKAYSQMLDMLYDEDVDQQAIIDTLDSIEDEIENKADKYAFIIKDLSSDIDKISAEITRLNKRKKALENRKESLKGNLYQTMKTVGKTKFKTALHSFSISSNGGKLPLVLLANEDEIPQEYKKATYSLDNDKIREAIDKGKCSFAKYGERGESLRIK